MAVRVSRLRVVGLAGLDVLGFGSLAYGLYGLLIAHVRYFSAVGAALLVCGLAAFTVGHLVRSSVALRARLDQRASDDRWASYGTDFDGWRNDHQHD